MSFSSLSQARSSVTDPTVDNGSTILYGNSNNLNTSTTFYTNTGRTVLAPAGNYVVATNYKSYYITIGGNGMMTGAAQELMQGTDTNWVDDELKNGDGQVDNWANIGGTSLSLSGTTLTDAVWTSRPYGGPKAWIIDVGTITTNPITNIDLSAMKGYDLRLITGEYTANKFVGTGQFLYTTSAIIHLAPDPNRQHTIGNMKYFFRPDYWIPATTFNTPSFFRRMPTITPIVDSKGYDKVWVDMAVPLMDVLYAGTHTVRQSTRMDKGITESTDVVTQWNGYTQAIPRAKRLFFDGDSAFRNSVAVAWGVNYNAVDLSDLWQHRTVALLLAHDVPENERSTWTYSGGGYTYTYAQANPYSWTTNWGQGTGQTSYGLPSQFVGYYAIPADINAIHHEYDFEHLSPALFSEAAGIAWNKCLVSATGVAEYQRSQGVPDYQGFVYPQFSNYGNGIYQSRYIGAPGYAWESMEPGNSITSTKLYSDYNDYYINGTIPYSQTGSYYAWFKGAIQNYKYHYVTNYQLRMNAEFQIYSLVHNTDITRKIITEILGANNDRRVCGYFWYKQEPIEGSDFGTQRKEVNINQSLRFTDRNRLEVCPSLMNAMAVWSMCYADGLFMWYQSTVGEETGSARLDRETTPLSDDACDAKWGDTTWVGKNSLDWAYVGYLHAKQNQDILSANTQWLVPNLSLGGGSWTSGTQDYPVSLYNSSRPIARYKLSADGTEALVLIYNGFNNGYTQDTFTFRLPAKSNYQFTANVWGNYTTVIRLKNL
jgi:hypothetical protein